MVFHHYHHCYYYAVRYHSKMKFAWFLLGPVMGFLPTIARDAHAGLHSPRLAQSLTLQPGLYVLT